MFSCIGREIEKEIRRNSISLASGYKRKFSPPGSDRTNQRIKYNSSGNIPIVISPKTLKSDNGETKDKDSKRDDGELQDEELYQESGRDPINRILDKTE